MTAPLSDEAGAHLPVWSPDGNHLVFDRTGSAVSICTRFARTVLEMTNSSLVPPRNLACFQPTGPVTGGFFCITAPDTVNGILWVIPASRAAKAEPFLETPANERQGQFSPDVRWVAYTSDESGTAEVYVRRFPGGDGKWRVSTHGGAQARWRRDGKELFYLAPDGNLMAADVRQSALTFETSPPRAVQHRHHGLIRGPKESVRGNPRRPAISRQSGACYQCSVHPARSSSRNRARAASSPCVRVSNSQSAS
jgi:hypothetical protein